MPLKFQHHYGSGLVAEAPRGAILACMKRTVAMVLQFLAIGLTVLACLLPGPAGAFQRLALVIGNDSYQNVNRLENARADARAMAGALQASGFEVTLRVDVTDKAMKEAVRTFKSQIGGGDDAVFFFSGHGVQLGAANYLLPVDIRGESEEQVKDDSLSLQRVLDDLQDQKAGFALAIIDACRNNPFKGTGHRSIGGRGLAPTSAATGQMVLFSAGSGQEALDRLDEKDRNPNGLFTRVLLQEIQRPGVPVDRILHNVRDEVVRLARSVGHEQVPALYDQALGEFYFHPPGGEPAGAADGGKAGASPGASSADAEEAYWLRIKDSRSIASFDAYLEKYPDGRYADAARASLHGSWITDAATGCKVWDTGSAPPDLTVSWSGKCANGKGEGGGTWEWKTGNNRTSYTGTLHLGRYVGHYQGIAYRSETATMKLEGESGVTDGGIVEKIKITTLEPDVPALGIEGTQVNGVWQGDYVQNLRNGATIHARMLDGKLNGRGTISGPGTYKYDGDFTDGAPTGRATITYTDGAVYVGDVVKRKKEGLGKLTHANGAVYEGQFRDDHYHGRGKLTSSSPNGLTYEGNFVEGNEEGVGKITSKDGSFRYEGDFRKNTPEGKGVEVSKGSRYIGDFANGKRHGHGVLITADGRRYEGQFIANEYAGK
jgi:hypothetical protein